MRRLALVLAIFGSACAAQKDAARIVVLEAKTPAASGASCESSTTPVCSFESLTREEVTIPGPTPDIQLFVMRIATPLLRKGAVMFTHGAGSASSASWDLRPGDYSFMRALACAGFDSYAVDIRGFGGSTMPPAMLGEAEAAPPAVRASEAIEDVHAAMTWASKTSSVAKLDLVGWSWGSDVAGWYAGAHPDRVRRLVLMSPVYDRRWPTRHQTTRAWYPQSRAEMEKLYSADREDRAVWDEFVASLYRFTKGDELRLPNGPYRDIYGEDAPLWDAAKIEAPVMVLRGERDAASVGVHAERLFTALARAKEKRYVVIGGTGHFVYRERTYRQTQSMLIEFLGFNPGT